MNYKGVPTAADSCHCQRGMTESIVYIAHRLKCAGAKLSIIDEDALQLIVNAAKGIPRKINGLAFRSMLAGIHKKLARIDANTVREVYAAELA